MSEGKFDALAIIEGMEGEGNEYQVKVVRFLADMITVLVERVNRLEERDLGAGPWEDAGYDLDG